MSEKYKITHSLLSSYAYQFECREECREDAREEFLSALRCEKSEPTEAMLNGINFENIVYGMANDRPIPNDDNYTKWFIGARQISDIIKGGQVQVRLTREIKVDGMAFVLVGVLDALKAGIIYDVKFKNKSFNSVDVYGDYYGSSQHPAYFYLCPEAFCFEYLVSDGESLYSEVYFPEDAPFIGDLIHHFLEGIKASGDFDTYKENWKI